MGSEMCIRDRYGFVDGNPLERASHLKEMSVEGVAILLEDINKSCLLYTSDAADDLLCVDLGGRRIIKKKNNQHQISSLNIY